MSTELVSDYSTASEDDNKSSHYPSTTGGEEAATNPQPTKIRRVSTATKDAADMMPQKFCHIRTSARQVRSEFYSAVDKLISLHHCSKNQAVSAVIIVANKLFGRPWKVFESESTIDINTAPSHKSIRETGRAIETYTLKRIVDEIMESDERAVITYHDDGSKKRCWFVHGPGSDNSW